MIGDCSNITNQHNRVGADIIRPQLCTISKYSTLQGQPLRLSVIGEADTKPQLMIIYPLPSRPAIIRLLYSPRFDIFFLFEKENACKRKATSGFHPETPATPRRSTELAALNQLLGTFARKRAGA